MLPLGTHLSGCEKPNTSPHSHYSFTIPTKPSPWLKFEKVLEDLIDAFLQILKLWAHVVQSVVFAHGQVCLVFQQNDPPKT